MADIHIKQPSKQRTRWWTVPVSTQEYKDGWDRIYETDETDENRECLSSGRGTPPGGGL
jgi:hypothetical protein